MKKIPIITFIIFIVWLTGLSGSAFCFNYKGIDVKVRCSGSESYDDNITFVNKNERKDFITDISLGLGLKYEGKTHSIELGGNIYQQLFAKYHTFNNTSEDLTLDFRQEFSKYDRITLKDVFTHTYEPRSFEDVFGRTPGRYSYFKNRLDLAYTKDITRQFSIGAKYSNEVNDISKEDINDSYLNIAGLEATYFPSSNILFMLSYDFTCRNFNPGSSATTHTVASGLRYYMTKQFYFDGRAGIDIINSYDNKNYAKPVILASLVNDIDENSRASISFAKRYYTKAYAQDLFDYWETRGTFTTQLYKRLGCSISGFYGEGEYIPVDVTDKLRGVSVAFTYDLSESSKGNLRYTYSDVTSTIDTREYNKNKIFLGISYEF